MSDNSTYDPTLHFMPAEGVVLRHALNTYRNNLSQRDYGPSLGDGFELAAVDILLDRLDALDARVLAEKRHAANMPVEDVP